MVMLEQRDEFVTAGGLRVLRVKREVPMGEALAEVLAGINERKGAIFASDYEYPGRYSRWDIGFIDPPIEIVGMQRRFVFRALNERGVVLLKLLRPVFEGHKDIESIKVGQWEIGGRVVDMPAEFAEEQRSKQPSIFSILRSLYEFMACEDEYLSVFGAFGYDLVFQFEPVRFKHKRSEDEADCHLFLADRIGAIDRQGKRAFKLSYEFEGSNGLSTVDKGQTGRQGNAEVGAAAQIAPVKNDNKVKTGEVKICCDHKVGEYAAKVERIRQGCKAGDFFEVVLSQVFSVRCAYEPLAIFERLRKSNPSPYDFLINLGDEQLIGASPEMYVRVEGRVVETCPISGTIQRGDSPMEDAQRIEELLNSRKDESELTMCTDVDRNDKSRVCKSGSVELVGRRLIESYSRLFHTVDHVKGILRDDCDMFDALLSHMWAGTLTGAPKPIAMQMIEDMENSPRRWYGGCVGLFTFNGQLNTGITIRTVYLRDGVASVRAGATLLYDSEPEDEEAETRVKASAFLQAVTAEAKTGLVVDGQLSAIARGVVNRSDSAQHRRVLFIDNRDSFVHTLANYVRQAGAEVITLRSGFAEKRFDEIRPAMVFISPGPGRPKDMGVLEVIGQALRRGLPIFGVCLGHQGIGQYFGAQLGVLSTPSHGKDSLVQHNGEGIFKGVVSPFPAGRYHSLYVKKEGLPDCLEITAESDDGIIMGLRHKELPVAGVQFHPESILTLHDNTGLKIIANVVGQLM